MVKEIVKSRIRIESEIEAVNKLLKTYEKGKTGNFLTIMSRNKRKQKVEFSINKKYSIVK